VQDEGARGGRFQEIRDEFLADTGTA
jgi:hypothetical protein